jgi:hypothetical protein
MSLPLRWLEQAARSLPERLNRVDLKKAGRVSPSARGRPSYDELQVLGKFDEIRTPHDVEFQVRTVCVRTHFVLSEPGLLRDASNVRLRDDVWKDKRT